MSVEAIPEAGKKSHIGGWLACSGCGAQTWNTVNGLCIRCRPELKCPDCGDVSKEIFCSDCWKCREPFVKIPEVGK